MTPRSLFAIVPGDAANYVTQNALEVVTPVRQEIRDVPSTFNPIKEVLIGQRYQYLLNDGWEI